MMEIKLCVWLVSSLIHMLSGCSLSEFRGVTGYTGGSVVLPCFCTDGGTIPRSARWYFQPGLSSILLWSRRRTVDHYKDRLLISDAPGNVSLRLSDLTLSDGGTYRCEADGHNTYRDITLTVEVGCVLHDSGPIHITGFKGHPVVLPCACTDMQKKPELIKWTAMTKQQSAVIFPPHPSSGRVQLLDSVSPGNLSLSLSGLTLSDGGTYRCEADGQYKDIILTVIHEFQEFCLKV